MVAIDTLFIRVKTGYNGTDGHVYVGIHGREFYIDSEDLDYNDFEHGADRIYMCGDIPSSSEIPPKATKIRNPSFNDPREYFPLDTDNLDLYPVYLRFEPVDDDDIWQLQYVSVQVNPVPRPLAMYEALDDNDDNIRLSLGGRHLGKYIYLHKVLIRDEPAPPLIKQS